MRFWKRSHTVKIFAHHKAYQELAVSKKSVPFTDVISAYKKDFLLFLRQQLLPFLRGCVRLIFTLCYEVGLFLVRSFETISGLGKKTSRVVAERSTFDGEFFRSTRSVFGVRLKFTMTVFALFMFSCLFLFEGGALVTRGLETKTQVLGLAGAGISNLQEAQDLLKKQNPTQAGQKFALALSHFQDSQKELAETGILLNSILSLTPQKKTADRLLEATTWISKAGIVMSNTVADMSDIKVTAQGINGDNSFARLEQAYTNLETAEDYARRASALISGISDNDLPASNREAFVNAAGKLAVLQSSLKTLDDLFHFALTLLRGQKKVLVLFENNNELRATGGFMGTFGAFDVTNGTIEQSHVSSIYDLDGQLTEAIAPPHPLRVLSDKFYLRDSNWFFDFRESSKTITTLYEKEGGETPDVVIVMTPQLIIDLLKLTGPIALHQYNVTLDENNFVEETQIQTSIKYDKTENKPKQMLADFMPTFLQRLSGLSAGNYIQLVLALERNLIQKQIMLYARDAETERLIDGFHWGGEVVDSDRDYLAVVSSNVGGTKTDLAMDQGVSLHTEFASDGVITNTLTITRSNTLPEQQGLENVSFLRIFVPDGSTLVKAVGFSEKPLPYVSSENYKTNPQVETWENNLSKNVVTGMVSGKEAGKTFFANWLTVRGGETKTVTLVYTLPGRLTSTDHYSLIVQKQPGTSAFDFDQRITFPAYHLTWSNKQPVASSSHDTEFKTRIDRDELMGYVFEKAF